MTFNKFSSDFANLIIYRIGNAVVKTATPTRAQNKIQVRVSWKDPNGRHGLGYYSMSIRSAEILTKKLTFNTSEVKAFIVDIFRTVDWANVQKSTYEFAHTELFEILDKLKVYDKVNILHKQAMDAIKSCLQSGIHLSQRQKRNREKAFGYLEQSVLFALKNGLQDDEINDIIKLCFIKHVHEA